MKKKRNLLSGFIWLPDRDSTRKGYLLKLDKEIKKHFGYVENKENKQRGFHLGELSTGSAIALYICRYLGDGIYFSDELEVLGLFSENPDVLSDVSDAVYFLIVSNGKILPGTDIVVKRVLYDFFIDQIAGTKYSDLNLRMFTKEDFIDLNRKYINDTIHEGKHSNMMWVFMLMVFLILCGGGLAWYILMA